MRRLAPPLARRFEQRLGSRPRLARAGEFLLHFAQGLLAALQLGLGESKIVCGLAPLALRRGDGVEQAAAPLLDLGGKIGKGLKVDAGLGRARAQGLDLLARLGDAVPPKLVLGADRLQPLLAQANFTLEALHRGLGTGMGRAVLGRVAMGALERRLERVERGKRKAPRRDPRQGGARLIEGNEGPALGLGKGAELLALGDALMLGLGDGVAGAAKLVACLAHLHAQRLGRFRSGMGLGA